MITGAHVMAIADGPTEVHQVTLAKQVLRDYQPSNDLFPAYSLPNLKTAAIEKYGDILDGFGGLEAAE